MGKTYTNKRKQMNPKKSLALGQKCFNDPKKRALVEEYMEYLCKDEMSEEKAPAPKTVEEAVGKTVPQVVEQEVVLEQQLTELAKALESQEEVEIVTSVNPETEENTMTENTTIENNIIEETPVEKTTVGQKISNAATSVKEKVVGAAGATKEKAVDTYDMLKRRIEKMSQERDARKREEHAAVVRAAMQNLDEPSRKALLQFAKITLLPGDWKELSAVVGVGAAAGGVACLLDVGTGGIVAAVAGGMVCVKAIWTAALRADELRDANHDRKVDKMKKELNKAEKARQE